MSTRIPEQRTGVAGESQAGFERVLAALLFAFAGGAWVLADRRMGGMDAGPGGELGDVGWFAVSWLLMMAAMMLPTITPMVLAYSKRSASAGANLPFVAGYLVTWGAVGLLGYAAVEGARSLRLGFLAWEEVGHYAAGAVVATAGLYQLTAPKRACLRACRDRRAFLRAHWRPGCLGAIRMGVAHGMVCVGCCWTLMAALFVVGAMSLAAMVFVAALIAAERLLPWGDTARRAVALVLVALGTAVAVAPGDVPGLTVPGHAIHRQAHPSRAASLRPRRAALASAPAGHRWSSSSTVTTSTTRSLRDRRRRFVSVLVAHKR